MLIATDLPEPVVPATKQVGHLGEFGDDVLTTDRLAQAERQPVLGGAERVGIDEFAEVHRLATLVGQLDADGVAAGHHGDARR